MSGDDPRSRTERLDAALTVLEAAVARGAAAEQTHADLTTSLAAMDEDRQRLAAELDAALARADRLEAASEAVQQRLEHAARRALGLLDGADA